jgi:hypothetical protein
MVTGMLRTTWKFCQSSAEKPLSWKRIFLSRQRFDELVTKAGTYNPSDIQKQTEDRNLKVLSDIDGLLSLVNPSTSRAGGVSS